jgi:hypothetical protein
MEFLRRRIGDYYTLEHIGSGGMSQVYLAVNPRTGEKRAAKILKRRASAPPADVVRFRREIEIISALHHPNIVRIFDSGAQDDFCYYMMEFVAGGSLSQRIASGRMRPEAALRVFMMIADAMRFAHEQGIVHRDLKPGNVLMRTADEACVSDFGIAKTLDGGTASLTKSNEILGTVAYLAPEQRFSSKRVDRRADVFALGAILYEMVMGFPPLGNFPWPRQTQSDFPACVQEILERCLALNPGERYDDAGHVSAAAVRAAAAIGVQVPQGVSTATRDFDGEVQPPVLTAVTDRVDRWLECLAHGTTRERLAAVKEMSLQMDTSEAQALLKLYGEVNERVRWGLIRVFGERRMASATCLILGELGSSYHRECAMEALGKIGAGEAFDAILEYVSCNPQAAGVAFIPLAQTGQAKALPHLRRYLRHEWTELRQMAARAVARIPARESIEVLQERLRDEPDERVRGEIWKGVRLIQSKLHTAPPTGAGDTIVLQTK